MGYYFLDTILTMLSESHAASGARLLYWNKWIYMDMLLRGFAAETAAMMAQVTFAVETVYAYEGHHHDDHRVIKAIEDDGIPAVRYHGVRNCCGTAQSAERKMNAGRLMAESGRWAVRCSG